MKKITFLVNNKVDHEWRHTILDYIWPSFFPLNVVTSFTDDPYLFIETKIHTFKGHTFFKIISTRIQICWQFLLQDDFYKLQIIILDLKTNNIYLYV